MIPPGVDTHYFSPGDSGGRDRGRLIAVGTLIKRKGYDVLKRSIAALNRADRQVHLVLVGYGPDEQPLRELAGELDIGSLVTFAGNVSRAELATYLRSAEVLCHPARYDKFPLEAMSCGLPALVSAAGAHSEIVSESGRVHPIGDSDALARNLIEVLSAPELRARLGVAARTRAVRQFTWQVMCDSYLSLYRIRVMAADKTSTTRLRGSRI